MHTFQQRNSTTMQETGDTSLQTPPPASSPLFVPISVDKAHRLTEVLNSAVKREKKRPKNPSRDSNCARIKELEGRLATCINEYKKYKKECRELKEKLSHHVEEMQSVSSLNLELQETLQLVHNELLSHEAREEEAAGDRELLILSHEKAVALLEKENILLQSSLHQANVETAEVRADLHSAGVKLSQHKQDMSLVFDRIHQENSLSLVSLKSSLNEAERRCEQLQSEYKMKECEMVEQTEFVKKLQALHCIETDQLSAALGSARHENDALHSEVERLSESVLAEEDVARRLRSAEVARVECEQAESERNDLQRSLGQCGKEGSATMDGCTAEVQQLKSELDEIRSTLVACEDRAATSLLDQQAETKQLLETVSGLDEAVQKSRCAEAALEIALLGKRAELAQLLDTVATLHAAMECGRREAERREEALAAVREALQKEEEKSRESMLEQDQKCSEVKSLQETAEQLAEEREQARRLVEELQVDLSRSEQQVESLIRAREEEKTTTQASQEAAERGAAEMRAAALDAEQGEAGGLRRSLQVLKGQKKAAQRRAETAEGRLQATASQLSDMTRARDEGARVEAVLLKRIARLEKCQAAALAGSVTPSPTSTSTRRKSEGAGDSKKAISPSVKRIARGLVLCGVAAASFYLGAVVGPSAAASPALRS